MEALHALGDPAAQQGPTLILIITTILDQDEGQCEVLGHDVLQLPPDEHACFRGKSIGFVFHAFNLLPALTATENTSVPLLLNGMSRRPGVLIRLTRLMQFTSRLSVCVNALNHWVRTVILFGHSSKMFL